MKAVISHYGLERLRAGAGFCQQLLTLRYGLRRVLSGYYGPRIDTWITTHEELRHCLAGKAVFDVLVEGMQCYMGYRAPD
ncbi:hypothetical protein [Chromobacterium sphagni]|uniref:Uncharacterized protein n=1 Tax=Chromobacterium sphagni TaxID=1903179 RepID=A0ABX3CGA3_9NEIS|nr:hypothetical protein [Chromobacterium sphagni]OHX21365.1 hypothetical protein BI344_02200 [Chromobacterium sphagni]